MKIELDGQSIHVATGGRQHAEGRPFLVLLHGAGNCHLTWVSQARALAYDGWNVIAPDLPGHHLSGGSAIAGVEAQAQWVLRLMDVLDCKSAVVAGHSQGGLIGLEMARQAPDRVRGLALIATAAAIPVNEKLIALSGSDQQRAIESMVDWGHGPGAHMHDNTWPGASLITYGVDVMELNPPGTLTTDLESCASYTRGEEAARGLSVPALCLFAGKDMMTPAKAGRALAALIPDCRMQVFDDAGHMLPLERPREVNTLLRAFLGEIASGAKAA